MTTGFLGLKNKLEAKGIEGFMPEFPAPENQKLESWLKILDESEMEIDEDAVLIGLSLGAVFNLNILNRRDLEIEAAYLFSAWTGLHPDEKFNELNSTFQDQEFDFEKIKGSARKIHQFYSEEDRYVPLEFAKELSENIGSNLHVRAGARHFNDDSGFKQFP